MGRIHESQDFHEPTGKQAQLGVNAGIRVLPCRRVVSCRVVSSRVASYALLIMRHQQGADLSLMCMCVGQSMSPPYGYHVGECRRTIQHHT